MAYRSVSYSSPGNTASVDPGKPAGTVNSDILIALIHSVPVGSGITAPAGWTVISSQADWVSSYLLWAPGSVASTQFDNASGTADMSCLIACFSGRDTTTPISASERHFEDSHPDWVSVTAAASDDVALLGIIYTSGGAAEDWGTVPSGFTNRLEVAGDGSSPEANHAFVLDTKDAVSAGATGAQTRTVQNEFAGKTIATVSLKVAAGVAAVRSLAGFIATM